MPEPPAKKSKESATMSTVIDKKGQSNQEGMAPPEKKSKESTTISMVVEKWEKGQTEQFSAVNRIKGYPWRLRLAKYKFGGRIIELWCDKSKEADMWMCTATIKPLLQYNNDSVAHSFSSFGSKAAGVPPASFTDPDKTEHLAIFRRACEKICTVGEVLEIEFEVDVDGEKWNHPILDPLGPFDGILVIGNEKINVNKAFLATQSSFFNNLFFGNFKEKNMTEITIEDVDREEFSNLLRIIYRLGGFTLTDENILNILHLAGRFDLKIVENVCVNYLLSSSSLSIHQKLLISEENNLPLLKGEIIDRYTTDHLTVLIESPEWEVLSKETTKALMNKCISLVLSARSENDYSD